MGDIRTSNVVLNLEGHAIDAQERGVSGLSSGSRVESLIQRIAVRDGTIKSRTSWGIRFIDAFKWDLDTPKALFFISSAKLPYLRDVDEKNYQEFLATRRALKQHFPQTFHRLERLTVDSATVAIEIRGADNQVRDNVLTTREWPTAIDLSGPHQVIENNIITVHLAPAIQHQAPIKLVMADNSIIRNNTIIIEGSAPNGPQAAISLVDSKNVVIENNKIVGTKTLYKIWDEEPGQHSSVILGQGDKANVFVPFWKRLLPQAWW